MPVRSSQAIKVRDFPRRLERRACVIPSELLWLDCRVYFRFARLDLVKQERDHDGPFDGLWKHKCQGFEPLIPELQVRLKSISDRGSGDSWAPQVAVAHLG